METLTIDPLHAARLLRATHGIDAGTMQPLGSELASTFRATTDRGTLAVKLQLSPAHETPVQRWRAELTARLHAAGLPVPHTIPALDGSPIGVWDADGVPISVLAIDWIVAHPYGDIGLDEEATARLGTELGRVAGRMQRVFADCPAPPREIDHTWTMHFADRVIAGHLAGQVPLPATAREIGERALELHSREVASRVAALPRALVHQDLHDANVLAEKDGTILGVIDFDDAVLGWRIAEPIVAAAYLARHGDSPAQLARLVLSGWEEEVPVTDDERAVFLPLVALRLALNSVVWAARASTDRGDYATARSRGSAATFARLADALDS